MSNRRSTFPSVAAACVLALTANAVLADEVFRWVDDDGVVHFSQWTPEDVEDVTTLVVNATNPPDYDPADNPYSIRKQAERMSDTWETLETKRAERREKRVEAEERERDARRQSDHRLYPYYPPYYSRPFYRPIRLPAHRPPHTRPPIFPPGKPVWPIKPSSERVDPMRSAHIGVRRNATPTRPAPK